MCTKLPESPTSHFLLPYFLGSHFFCSKLPTCHLFCSSLSTTPHVLSAYLSGSHLWSNNGVLRSAFIQLHPSRNFFLTCSILSPDDSYLIAIFGVWVPTLSTYELWSKELWGIYTLLSLCKQPQSNELQRLWWFGETIGHSHPRVAASTILPGTHPVGIYLPCWLYTKCRQYPGISFIHDRHVIRFPNE